VTALHRKLLRDLWATKTQVLSIALVIACGIGGSIASFSTHQSLLDAREHYYEVARFPHLFAEAKRAPVSLLREISSIPGVAEAETRVVRDVQLDLPAIDQPITARVIGLALDREQGMNRLTLRSGRWPTPGALGEVLVNQRFAEVRNVKPGDSVRVLLNGKREELVVVGTVLSPEYIFATRGGALPDDEWFAVLWIDAKQLAAAFNMEGAFNSVLLRLEHGASPSAAADALDALLESYGTRGAYGRDEQISHKIISQEIDQQRVMGTVIPGVFLLVAAFILNVVLHRQVNAQRGEIAALKALGYDNQSIAAHYLAYTSVVVGAGLLIGLLVGDWFGRSMTHLYTDVFHFPDFAYSNVAWVVIGSTGVAMIAAFGGALSAIAGVVRLKPAEALRAPAPAQFRPLLVERLGVPHLLSASARNDLPQSGATSGASAHDRLRDSGFGGDCHFRRILAGRCRALHRRPIPHRTTGERLRWFCRATSACRHRRARSLAGCAAGRGQPSNRRANPCRPSFLSNGRHGHRGWGATAAHRRCRAEVHRTRPRSTSSHRASRAQARCSCRRLAFDRADGGSAQHRANARRWNCSRAHRNECMDAP
jgi:putative ABC transport system permease protein